MRCMELQVFIALALGCLLNSTALQGQTRDWSLNGLEVEKRQAIQVVLEDLSTEAIQIGLKTDSLKATCQLRLGHSGILITSDEKAGVPYLYVAVIVRDLAFSVEISFRRTVKFEVRGETLYSTAAMWDAGADGVHGKNPDNVVGAVDLKVDEFLKEFLKANPNYR